ncbi:hypothetical protein N7495_005640 [Penicillium taxi]|uniref:uncharacterized protein n=1 Tax=Penicillium taxi TaxID=168475 RepID=UPI0025458C39|nr:uncharacterized protein N7495_005640 [Penicillium taxi]KAJ5893949.1 hypothetical protein N7495_005640 [Penicillium taxi]
MNSTINPIAAPVIWQEARTAEGRPYYYNVETKVTQWKKPEELMTPAEVCINTLRASANVIAASPWKEYVHEDGRKYWVNSETKESTWKMPDAYKNALAADSSASLPTSFAGRNSNQTYPQNRDRNDYHDRGGYNERRGYGGGHDKYAMVAIPASGSQFEPEYHTIEEAEAAFMKMLKRHNVGPDWTWEQTVRATIKDPQYRALRDPCDRQAAFDKYAIEVRVQEKERAKERFAKLRADFTVMLKRHPEIKYYSRWKTIRPILEGETTFRTTNDESERRQLFDEYVVELKKAHVELQTATHKAAMEELIGILNSLDLEPYTRWSEAHAVIQSHEKIQTDDKFKSLSKSDILTAFENHIKILERTFNDARQEQKATRARKERHCREQFLELLAELKSQGKIKAGSKWVTIRPLIQDDPRYQGILGRSGSTPMDLFWDVVEEEERSIRAIRNHVLDVLDDHRQNVTPSTTLDEFNVIMASDRRTSTVDPEILTLIFQRLQDKAIRRSEEEKHAADRHQRRAVDALRSLIKHLEPQVRVTDTWEQVQPRLEKYDEYKAVESDELRQSAFEKVISRLKEKDDEFEKEREFRNRRDHERSDRDYRSTRGELSPEQDAYEADRRKAQAERERTYRKITEISSPTDRRDDRDRYRRDVDRRSRDLDRREDERERLYRTRGDPRGGRDELDYGDTRSHAVSNGDRRRRRESDASVASRSVKRYRRDSREPERSKDPRKDRTLEPAIIEEVKIAKATHSGSEEGEIEDD